MGKWPKLWIQFGLFLQKDMKEYYDEQQPMAESHLSHCKHEKRIKHPTCPQTARHPRFQKIRGLSTATELWGWRILENRFRREGVVGRGSVTERREHTFLTTMKPEQSVGASENKNNVMTPYFNCDNNNSVDLQSPFNFLWFTVNV